MKRLILLSTVCLWVLIGCTLPRAYPVPGLEGVTYVNYENSRQDGPNVACIDRWIGNKLVRSDCTGGPSLSQSVLQGTFQGSVAAGVADYPDYDGDEISIDNKNAQKQAQKQKDNKKHKKKHRRYKKEY